MIHMTSRKESSLHYIRIGGNHENKDDHLEDEEEVKQAVSLSRFLQSRLKQS